MTAPTTPPAWLDLLAHRRVSQAMGHVVRARPPKPVLQAAIRAFATAYRVDLAEMEAPLDTFDSFQAFFTRKLKLPGLKTMSLLGLARMLLEYPPAPSEASIWATAQGP